MGRRRARVEGSPPALPEGDEVEVLISRARRARSRGDRRAAVVLLRQACALDAWRARTFTLLGVLLSETRQTEDALQALGHARWLRTRAGETSRANATTLLIERARAA